MVGAKGKNAVEIVAQGFGHGGKILLDEVLVEYIVASGHRRMRSEHRASRHQLPGGFEIHSLLHAEAAALEQLEGSVAFIDVRDRRREAQGLLSSL